METFLRNKTFEIDFTLLYSDDSTPLDLDLLTEITVEIRKTNGGPILVTKTLTGGTVHKVTPASGICSVHIEKSETKNVEKGQYDYIVSVQAVNADYASNLSDFGGFDKCFMLE